MKIVVLDGFAENPGDLSWDWLGSLADDFEVHDRTPDHLIVNRSSGSEILFTNKTPLTEDTFSRLPDLKYIGVLATGYNVVDIEAAKKRSITVTNIPSYATESVAQMVFAHIFELCRHIAHHCAMVQQGKWAISPDFCFWDYPQVELNELTIGLLGFGRIGRAVARIALSMGMDVLACDVVRAEAPELRFQWVELDELLAKSDIVSLHCPLFPSTEGIINSQALTKMKRSAFLINTSRGGLVVDSDLAEALNKGTIAGAGLDVLSGEPPDANNPLLTAKNCTITPHIAWATHSSRSRLMDTAADNLRQYLAGNSVNTV